MSKRCKKPVSSLRSLEDCNAVLRRIARLDIELEKIEGEADLAIAMALRSAERRSKSKIELKTQLVGDLMLYCEEHKDELTLSPARRTVEMLFGRVGWRLTPEKLKIAKGFKIGGKRPTWDELVGLVREKLGAAYIRVKEEVKKDEIKKASFDDEQLLEAGLAIDQHDEWFYEVVDRTALATPGVRAGGSAAPASDRHDRWPPEGRR